MLDKLRRHSSSWLIKTILAAIIITFVLFFGYSNFDSQFGDSNGEVATVDGLPIPEKLYQFYYERNYDNLRESLKGSPAPDFAQKMVENSTMQQLVERTLLLHAAKKIGVEVTDDQLAAAVIKNQKEMRGQFDPIFYRHEYLPYFSSRFGMDFEAMLRDDLTLQTLFEVLGHATIPLAPSIDDAQKSASRTWTFDVVTLDTDAMKKDGRITETTSAETIAKAFIATADPRHWKKLAELHKLDVKRVGPITIADYRRLFPKPLDLKTLSDIFTLRPEKPILPSPISKENMLAVIKLVEQKEKTPKGESPVTVPSSPFLTEWMQQVFQTAKVSSSLLSQANP